MQQVYLSRTRASRRGAVQGTVLGGVVLWFPVARWGDFPLAATWLLRGDNDNQGKDLK